MARFFPVAVLLFLFNVTLLAQTDYKTSVGVRIGAYTYFNGTVKHFISEQGALEAVVGLGFNRARVGLGGYSLFGGALLYQHHFQLSQISVPGFNIYIGGGPLAGINIYRLGSNVFDLAGVIGGGIDYQLQDFPVNLSFDFYPGVRILPGFGLAGFGGVSARYILQ
jgi:hypothetical protein